MEYLSALVFLPLDSATALYAVLFSILIFSGVGLPVPEEVTLLLGGYLAYLGFVEFYPTLYVLVLGIVVADTGGYLLGRLAGNWPQRRISRFPVATMLIEKGKTYFERHGEKVVLFSRPLMGVRVVVPILAGHFRMNFAKFVFYDTLGAIPWTVLLVFVSYYFGAGLDLIVGAGKLRHGLFLVLILAVIVASIVKFIKNKKSVGMVQPRRT